MRIQGTFEVESQFEPPFFEGDGITMGRAKFTKHFAGDLSAESTVEFLHASVQEKQSGVYVAVERVVGTLLGKRGSFCLHHTGLRDRGAQSLAVHVVPDSGTGELEGLRGTMTIDIVEGKHYYGFEFTLASASA